MTPHLLLKNTTNYIRNINLASVTVVVIELEAEKCLIISGVGFIGSHLVDKRIKLGANITIVDNLSKGSLNNIFNKSFKRS